MLFILESMENVSILVWNVRGLNDRGKRDNLRKVVDDFQTLCGLFTGN